MRIQSEDRWISLVDRVLMRATTLSISLARPSVHCVWFHQRTATRDTAEPSKHRPRCAYTIINNDKRSAATTIQGRCRWWWRRDEEEKCLTKFCWVVCINKAAVRTEERHRRTETIINPPYKQSNHLSRFNLWSPLMYLPSIPRVFGLV